MKMEPGIHTLTRDEYDAIDAVNASLLKACDRSMAHGKAYLDGHRKESAAMAFGSAYHLFVLEPDLFAKVYEVYSIPPDAKTKWGKEYWEEQGKTLDKKMLAAAKAAAAESYDLLCEARGESHLLTPDDAKELEAMRSALLAESRRRALTATRGRYEVSIVWTDTESGLLCKARMDKVIESLGVIVDLKTTSDARPHAFFGDAARYGYDLQAAFYMDGLHAITGKEHDFAFLAQESDAPYASMMYTATWGGDMHQIGRAKYRPLLAMVAKAKQTGAWPGYGDDPVEVVIPQWSVPDSLKQGAFA